MKKTHLILKESTDGGEKEQGPGNVTLGNGNAVNINDIPLITFFRCVEEEIKAKVSSDRARAALLSRLQEMAQDPTFAPILSTPVGQLLTRLF